MIRSKFWKGQKNSQFRQDTMGYPYSVCFLKNEHFGKLLLGGHNFTKKHAINKLYLNYKCPHFSRLFRVVSLSQPLVTSR